MEKPAVSDGYLIPDNFWQYPIRTQFFSLSQNHPVSVTMQNIPWVHVLVVGVLKILMGLVGLFLALNQLWYWLVAGTIVVASKDYMGALWVDTGCFYWDHFPRPAPNWRVCLTMPLTVENLPTVPGLQLCNSVLCGCVVLETYSVQ